MTKLINLIQPPPDIQSDDDDYRYQFYNKIFEALQSLTALANPSILLNANFATLSAQGTTPTTQADGDDFEFIQNWYVIGSTAATYALTATQYLANSTEKSQSDYYMHVVVNTYTGSGLYFYQRQLNTLRKYQKNYFTYTVRINNNGASTVQVRMDMFHFYDPSSATTEGKTIDIEPGINEITSTVLTPSLNGITVGAGSYTEFRLIFSNLPGGIADLDIYFLKCEFGSLSTPLVA